MDGISLSTPLPPIDLSQAIPSGDLARAGARTPETLAGEFEGLFVSLLIKQMRQASGDGDGLFPGDSSDTFGGMFDMYLGQHIAQNGGIGLAAELRDSIAKQFSATGSA